MKLRNYVCILLWIFVSWAALTSCSTAQAQRISLASFTENYVEVSIRLEKDAVGQSVLSATFTPPIGYHLYSKDIPIMGVDGLGRPTLLELTSNSHMKAMGSLMESVKAGVPDFEPKELLVYPRGAVTLSLAVELPPGHEWTADEVMVTYMACSSSLCKPPVVGKIVPVRVPGADRLDGK